MNNHAKQLSSVIFSLLALAAAGCGGGGGGALPSINHSGSSTASPAASPTASPTSSPTTSPTAQPSPEIQAAATIGGSPVTNGVVVFSCGCSAQAGTVSTDAQGNFTIPTTSSAIPASPNPTYTTVPGRNYLIIAKASTGAEAWTMAFLGKTPSHNVGLGAAGAFTTDVYTAAAALYVFFASPPNSQSDLAFDQWNFYNVQQWADDLRTGTSHTQHELNLLKDITTAQTAGGTLFPGSSPWYPGQSLQPNGNIKTDLSQIQVDGTKVDPALPTPCPGGIGSCTGAPKP